MWQAGQVLRPLRPENQQSIEQGAMNLPLLDAGIFYELQISDQRPADLLEEAVAFEGSLRLHYNPGLVLLLLLNRFRAQQHLDSNNRVGDISLWK